MSLTTLLPPIRVTPQLKRDITNKAKENRRPRAEEVRIALEKHCELSKSEKAGVQ
jgi:hypothetical protein